MGEVQLAPIVFSGSEDKSSTELGGAQPLVVNVLPDATGSLRRRPGIKAWDVFPAASASGSPVVGMMSFGEQLVYVTEDRKLHAISAGGGVLELSSAVTTSLLEGSARPSLVAGRQMLVAAGGGAIQKWVGAGLSERLLNTGVGGPPPDSSFLCAIAQRLVAQVVGNSGYIWWTGPNEEYENWDMSTGGASLIQAAAKPDPLQVMYDNTNEVFAFGSETLQVFAPAALAIDVNDLNNLLDFAPSRTMNLGTNAPYSVVAKDDMFALLDRQRRCILTDGRSFKDISTPIAQFLRDLQRIDDAWAFRMRFGRFDCLVWMFPTDGKGLIWDAQSNNWCEWRSGDGSQIPVSITSAYNWAEKNAFLVGMSDGSIAQLDDAVATDLVAPIRVDLMSGFTSHGSMAQKVCNTLLLQFKRTWAALPAPQYGLSPSGHVRISKRDDQGAWEIIEDIELSDSPDTSVQIRSLGVYRTRQWRLEYTGADELQLVSAQEEFEILGA